MYLILIIYTEVESPVDEPWYQWRLYKHRPIFDNTVSSKISSEGVLKYTNYNLSTHKMWMVHRWGNWGKFK